MRTSVESDESSVDPDTDEDIDDELFGTKSDNSSMASNSSDTHMEDVTKATSCIDITYVNNDEGYEIFEDNQSSSVQGLPNSIVCEKLTKFLNE